MKKFFALLLSLMLLLPAFALGEALPAVDTYTVEFEDFTITVTSEDIIQRGEKAEQQILFILYPAYDETSIYHPNINALWTAEDLGQLGSTPAEDFGNTVLEQSVQLLQQQGIAVTNPKLVEASFDEESKITTLITSMDADYSGAGIDLAISMCQMQMYVPMAEGGSYIFTLSSTSLEGLDALLNYMNTVMFAD